MQQGKNVMVCIEENDGRIADVSKELICEAGKLARKLNCGVEAVALGYGLSETVASLGQYGCRRVYYVDDERLKNFTSVPYALMIAEVIRKYTPQIVLFGASVNGRDVAPRVASELKCGLTADCTALDIGDYKAKGRQYDDILLQIRPAFGGNIVATIVSPESDPSMATVREGVMKMNAPDTSLPAAEVVTIPCSLSGDCFPTNVIEIKREKTSVNITSANIVIGAGMGASSPEALKLVYELAQVLGAEVAASRPVADGGMLERERQVGQTGRTVRPNLYIACGISGQIQHRAGMAESKRIIAINSDPDAPIFKIAHYGIVGDVTDVIPKMIKAYKSKSK